jgi:hypothetical protein
MRRDALLTFAGVIGVAALLIAADASAQGSPATQGRPKPVAPPVRTVPAPATQQPGAPRAPTTEPAPAVEDPSEATLGVPFYPGMQFVESYDAGSGQRYYLFGSGSSFADVVAYYRSALRQRGELVFEVPATHQFDIGRFNEDTMAFPPSVTVKDYMGVGLQGYPNPKPGAQPPRYSTIVQVVPIPPAAPAPIKR